MGISVLDVALTILISATVGAISSLIAPWANWGVEKRKRKLLWRKGFINEWKRIISENRFNPDVFRETSYYSNLKLHLSDALQKEINEERYTPGKPLNREQRMELSMKEFSIKKKLLDEITLLEKKWGLI